MVSNDEIMEERSWGSTRAGELSGAVCCGVSYPGGANKRHVPCILSLSRGHVKFQAEDDIIATKSTKCHKNSQRMSTWAAQRWPPHRLTKLTRG